MPIVARASGGTSYPPAPAGSHSAVCCDVVDLGDLEVTYNGETKKQHKIQVIWQLAEDRDDGKPHQVRKRYTLSLHEKASLRKDLESWRGKPFTDEELDGFDVEVLVGVPCMLSVVHAAVSGKTYANVAAVMKLPKGLPPLTVSEYVRVCDREPAANAQPTNGNWNVEITDDEVPF